MVGVRVVFIGLLNMGVLIIARLYETLMLLACNANTNVEDMETSLIIVWFVLLVV